ncbi:hypothetical protein BLNAU_4421 [Blattamonas nauphoetae]|uniref:Uncharacterized protein n=1 Tax=Blattamonas nauphoetae TaxID=2049346 RepID=A0ABQ9Y9T0_9EUKA|nr:hypothetical protein BLNAU_22888 [Blattamonas nauphoetae]KAK2960523.1 hypothetical protein BLNAU_4421 [Blattamonas nauphoetae]
MLGVNVVQSPSSSPFPHPGVVLPVQVQLLPRCSNRPLHNLDEPLLCQTAVRQYWSICIESSGLSFSGGVKISRGDSFCSSSSETSLGDDNNDMSTNVCFNVDCLQCFCCGL